MRIETWAQIKRRHAEEKSELVRAVIKAAKTKRQAAEALGMTPDALYMFCRHHLADWDGRQ